MKTDVSTYFVVATPLYCGSTVDRPLIVRVDRTVDRTVDRAASSGTVPLPNLTSVRDCIPIRCAANALTLQELTANLISSYPTVGGLCSDEDLEYEVEALLRSGRVAQEGPDRYRATAVASNDSP